MRTTYGFDNKKDLDRFLQKRKPQIGLTPRYISEEWYYHQRIEDIKEAINRYKSGGFTIPKEWEEEIIDIEKISQQLKR